MDNTKMMKALTNIKYSLGTKVYAKFLAQYNGDEYEYVSGVIVGINYNPSRDRLEYDIHSTTENKTYKSLADHSIVPRD